MRNKHLTIDLAPMSKPRMTQRDRWKKRPCVLRYFAWKDELRRLVGELPEDPVGVSWNCYFPFPKSWTKKKKRQLAGMLHRSKPDRDNVDKAILDALWNRDERVSEGSLVKRWEDNLGPRIELFIFWGDE